jgi:hypothetical protein
MTDWSDHDNPEKWPTPRYVQPIYKVANGITAWDYFAAAVIQGELAVQTSDRFYDCQEPDVNFLVKKATIIADAMMKARMK